MLCKFKSYALIFINKLQQLNRFSLSSHLWTLAIYRMCDYISQFIVVPFVDRLQNGNFGYIFLSLNFHSLRMEGKQLCTLLPKWHRFTAPAVVQIAHIEWFSV